MMQHGMTSISHFFLQEIRKDIMQYYSARDSNHSNQTVYDIVHSKRYSELVTIYDIYFEPALAEVDNVSTELLFDYFE
jgi:hypothetical protein